MEGSDPSRNEATFKFIVNHVSSLKYTLQCSPPVYICNLPWRIRVRKFKNAESKYHLSAYLQCNHGVKDPSWSVYAFVKISIIPQRKEVKKLTYSFFHRYYQTQNDYGYATFAPWNDVETKYAFSNSFTLEVQIIAEAPILASVSVYNVSGGYKDHNSAQGAAAFRLIVRSYRTNNGEVVSPACYIANLPWKIIAKTSEPKVGQKRIDLFLQCNHGNSFDPSWQCEATAVLRIASQIVGVPSISKEIHHVFDYKSSSWGCEPFVIWNDVINDSQDFDKYGSIIVEAVVLAKPAKLVSFGDKNFKGNGQVKEEMIKEDVAKQDMMKEGMAKEDTENEGMAKEDIRKEDMANEIIRIEDVAKEGEKSVTYPEWLAELQKLFSMLQQKEVLTKIVQTNPAHMNLISESLGTLEQIKFEYSRTNGIDGSGNIGKVSVPVDLTVGKMTSVDLIANTPQYKDLIASLKSLLALADLSSQENYNSSVPITNDASLSNCSICGDLKENKAESEGTIKFIVKKVSKVRESRLSPPVYIRNLPWQISVEQTGTGKNKSEKSLGFYVQCNRESEDTTWSCFATIEMKVLSQKEGGKPISRKFDQLFSSGASSWGYRSFILWNEMLDPRKGYIKDNTIILEVFIKAKKDQS